MLTRLRQKLKDGLLRDLIAETRWIYRYARDYRRGMALYVLLGIAATGAGLGGSLAAKSLIDAVVGRRDSVILAAAALYAGFGLGRLVLTALSRLLSARLSLRAGNEIRAHVFRQFLAVDWQSSLDYHSGDLLTRVSSDVSTVADSILGWLPSLITCSVQFFATLAVILFYDPVMALLALVSAPVTVLLSRFLVSNLQHFGRQMRDAQAQLTAFYEEALQNLQAIKSFSLHHKFNTRLDALQQLYRDVRLEYENFSVRTHLLLSGMGLGVSGLCFAWGVYRLWSGYITFGTMVLFIQMASLLSASFSALVGLIPPAISATVSAGRIMAILDLPQEDLTVTDQARYVIENAPFHGVSVRAEHLSFSYDRGRQVFEDLSLHAEPGEIIALVSPSGGGKTSFIRALLGLVAPAAGQITLVSAGHAAPLSPCMRPLITYVAQEKVVFSGTIADSLRLSDPLATDDQLEQALRLACAWDFVSQLPGGVNYTLKERGAGLSEGQLQRLAIARALLSSAPVMLLDEATSALDLATEKQVLANMLSDPRRTVIVTTHRPTVLGSCDRVYSIRDGRARVLTAEEIQAFMD